MILGIDARFFGPKSKGLGRYVQRLLESYDFISLDQDKVFQEIEKIVVFLNGENWNDFRFRSPIFEKVLTDYKCYGLKEQLFFPFKIWKYKIDLMHFPHFNAPVFCPKPFVVTIHDLILQHFPTVKGDFLLGKLRYKFKEFFYKIIIRLVAKRSEKIIAVSKFTKRDIVETLNISADKVVVIYEGVCRKGFLPNNKRKAETMERFGIKKPYIIYVGNAYPHKNLERLILAFGQIKNEKYQLVLAGETFYFTERLKQFAEKEKKIKADSIIFTGFVGDDELETLYAGASLYIFPSLYEGFGLPPLEAMVHGVPVASSNKTSLPEILGEAAVYFNPHKIEEIEKTIISIMENKGLRENLCGKAYDQIRKYDWLKCAEKTLEVLTETTKNIDKNL